MYLSSMCCCSFHSIQNAAHSKWIKMLLSTAGKSFAVYGRLPKDTSDRDMAGKIALEDVAALGSYTVLTKTGLFL